eukprot:2006541-Amphidinium_carterae.1
MSHSLYLHMEADPTHRSWIATRLGVSGSVFATLSSRKDFTCRTRSYLVPLLIYFCFSLQCTFCCSALDLHDAFIQCCQAIELRLCPSFDVFFAFVG